MGFALTEADESAHDVGPELNWNESRYVDVWDAVSHAGGWFRIGNRPNARYAEMSACVYLPDGRVAFDFERAEIDGNGLAAGPQAWVVGDPFRVNHVHYAGEMIVLDDPWLLRDPKRAFTESPRADVAVDLTAVSTGLATVMGADQDHVGLIFLPGQADFHYQHLAHVTGTVRVGDQSISVDGYGGKDHSWGPRNWHAKIYLRWLIAATDDGNGFMLTRAVGPTKQTRSGFVLDEGAFHVVDDFDMRNAYADAPHHELHEVRVEIRSGDRRWSATGRTQSWLPARHRQQTPSGDEAILRIVKSPTEWRMGDGRRGVGHCEYHDLVVDGRPVGLDD
jgi:hypothetical protein